MSFGKRDMKVQDGRTDRHNWCNAALVNMDEISKEVVAYIAMVENGTLNMLT